MADASTGLLAKLSLVHRANSVQTNVIVGVQAIEHTSPDYYVLQVLNKILGGGPFGRLFNVLREEKGYTYRAGTNLTTPRYRGTLTVSTPVRNEVTGEALQEILNQIARMRNERVPDQEFRAARRSLVARFALSLESADQVLRYFVPAGHMVCQRTTGTSTQRALWPCGACRLEQRRWRDPQRLCEQCDVYQRRVPLATFNSADIGPVEVGSRRKLLFR